MKTTKFLSLLLICLSIHFSANADDWVSYENDSVTYTMVMDSSYNVWYGSVNNSIKKFNGSSWSVDTVLSCRFLGIAFTDKSGNIWMPTNTGGVYKYDKTTWINYTTSNSSLTSNNLWAGTEDKLGNIWLTSPSITGGIFKYDGSTWTNYTIADGLVGNNAYSMVQDSLGNMWFGTTAGVSKFDGSTWTNYTTTDGLVNNYAYYMYVDKSGNIWVSSIGYGISKYDGSTWTTYTTSNCSLVSNNIELIFQDKRGAMWFLGNGVSKFDGSTWTSVTTDDGLIDNAVFCGLQHPITGDIWFGTNKGISKFTQFSASTDTLNFDATGGTASVKITTYKDWSVLVSNWVTVSAESGSGDSTITVTVGANPGTSKRTGSIALIGTGVNAQLIVVNQSTSVANNEVLTTNLSITPNPVKDAFQVNGLNGTATLSLTDTNGKVVLNKEITGNESVSVSSLPQGLYIVKLATANGTVQQKLIKQ